MLCPVWAPEHQTPQVRTAPGRTTSWTPKHHSAEQFPIFGVSVLGCYHKILACSFAWAGDSVRKLNYYLFGSLVIPDRTPTVFSFHLKLPARGQTLPSKDCNLQPLENNIPGEKDRGSGEGSSTHLCNCNAILFSLVCGKTGWNYIWLFKKIMISEMLLLMLVVT